MIDHDADDYDDYDDHDDHDDHEYHDEHDDYMMMSLINHFGSRTTITIADDDEFQEILDNMMALTRFSLSSSSLS